MCFWDVIRQHVSANLVEQDLQLSSRDVDLFWLVVGIYGLFHY